MNRRWLLVLTVILALAVVGVAYAASVEPVLVDPWQSGDAAFECEQAGCAFDFSYKFDEWDGPTFAGPYNVDGGNVLTISDDDGYSFSWSSAWPVNCVIVKGGNAANVYCYDEPVYGDTGMFAPINPNNDKPYGISHATFCYDEPEEEECFAAETAWAAGSRYVARGNWATFTPYVAESTVTLYAGQTIDVGTVHFSAVDANGEVTITINLTGSAKLNLGTDEYPNYEAVKIQGYNAAPSGNPSPGLFTTYKGNDLTVTVPAFAVYGVHVDVLVPVTCM